MSIIYLYMIIYDNIMMSYNDNITFINNLPNFPNLIKPQKQKHNLFLFLLILILKLLNLFLINLKDSPYPIFLILYH